MISPKACSLPGMAYGMVNSGRYDHQRTASTMLLPDYFLEKWGCIEPQNLRVFFHRWRPLIVNRWSASQSSVSTGFTRLVSNSSTVCESCTQVAKYKLIGLDQGFDLQQGQIIPLGNVLAIYWAEHGCSHTNEMRTNELSRIALGSVTGALLGAVVFLGLNHWLVAIATSVLGISISFWNCHQLRRIPFVI